MVPRGGVEPPTLRFSDAVLVNAFKWLACHPFAKLALYNSSLITQACKTASLRRKWLSHATCLRAAGVTQEQAEAHAEAARDFVMAELVTKSDLQAALDALSLRLSVRLGLMLATGIGILAAIIKL
jgi:hypothetical protein